MKIKKIKHNMKYTCEIQEDKCILCEMCVDRCPFNCIYTDSERIGFTDFLLEVWIDPVFCEVCGDCISICPNDAIIVRERKEWE